MIFLRIFAIFSYQYDDPGKDATKVHNVLRIYLYFLHLFRKTRNYNLQQKCLGHRAANRLFSLI